MALLVSSAPYGAAVKRGLDDWNNGEGMDTIAGNISITVRGPFRLRVLITDFRKKSDAYINN